MLERLLVRKVNSLHLVLLDSKSSHYAPEDSDQRYEEKPGWHNVKNEATHREHYEEEQPDRKDHHPDLSVCSVSLRERRRVVGSSRHASQRENAAYERNECSHEAPP